MQSGPHGSVIARYDDGKNAEVKRGAPRVDLNLPHSRDEEARARFHNELMMKFRLLPLSTLVDKIREKSNKSKGSAPDKEASEKPAVEERLQKRLCRVAMGDSQCL